MKNLVLGSLVAMAASQAAGCVVNNNGGGDGAHVQASWKIISVDAGGNSQEATCPPNATTAAVFSQEIDPNGSLIGQPYIDLFNCTDGSGITSHLPFGLYDEWVELTDDTGQNEVAESPHVLQDTPNAPLDLTAGDQPYTGSVVVNGGQFELTWHLVGAQSNAMLDCAAAGAQGGNSGVEAITTVVGSMTSFDDKFDCQNPTTNLTDPLPPDNYTVSVDAFNSSGALGQPVNMTGTIVDPATDPTKPVSDLGEIAIPIDGM